MTIEPDTAAAIRRRRELLQKIAVERLYAEMRKLLAGVNAPRVLRDFSDVVRVFLPELSQTGLRAVENTPQDGPLRFALLLTGANAGDALRRLHADNKTIRAVCELHTTLLTDGRHLLAALEPDQAYRRVAYAAALGEIGKDEADARAQELQTLLTDKPCLTLRELAVNGRDMQLIGLAGTQIGKTLNALLERVLSGTLENDREQLLNEVERMVPDA